MADFFRFGGLGLPTGIAVFLWCSERESRGCDCSPEAAQAMLCSTVKKPTLLFQLAPGELLSSVLTAALRELFISQIFFGKRGVHLSIGRCSFQNC